jgi:threonine/homoserine/homoserine lactone efflux protein|tara:strand:+ start:982 stop:1581 length:600 start_codon:yes stop_codon:yes gene_type:complete
MHFEVLPAMALFVFVASVTPGPNNTMLLASGVNFGYKQTLPHLLGISVGHFILLMAVGNGLEAVFNIYPVTYQAMKIIGVSYLMYLAVKIIRSNTLESDQAKQARPLSFIGGAAFQWVNPKAWMMSIGFFSTYMPEESSMTFVTLSCLMFSLINFPTISLWAGLGTKMVHYLQNIRLRTMFNWMMALLLIISMIPAFLI